MRAPLIALVALTVPSTAEAELISPDPLQVATEPLAPVSPPDPEPSRSAYDLTIALAGGAMNLGPYEFGGMGVRGAFGLDLGPFHLALDQALLYFASPTVGQDASGLFSRTGLSARIPIGEWAYQDGALRGEFEIGAGWQRMPADPSVSRWDVAVGWMTEVRAPKVGILLGGRFLAAPEREGKEFFAVAGTEKRNNIDIGILVTLGARFKTERDRDPSARHSMADRGEAGDVAGFEYALGMRNFGGTRFFAGTIAARRSRDFGRASFGAEGSVGMLSSRDREMSSVTDSGLMARIGATAKYSLWQPTGRTLRGDFFLDGGAGYTVGSVTSGRFHDVDLQAGGGAGYELLASNPDSPARSLSAYVALRAVVPARDVSRLGFTFGVGLGWRR